jgi:hypothetical protein
MIQKLLEKYFGVEFKQENIVWVGIIPTIGIIVFTYLIVITGGFFDIVDNLIETSKQPFYVAIITKFSFLMISVNMIIRSLFSNLNNPWGRFTAAFVIQFFGFIMSFVMVYILNTMIKGYNVPSETQTILGFLPFISSIMISLIIRYIYNVEYFDDKEFFKSFSN